MLIPLRMLAVFLLFVLCQPVWGEDIDSLYQVFMTADDAHRVKIVNTVSKTLHDSDITDSLYQCNKNTRPAMVDAMMHYLLAEYLFNEGEYDEALEVGTTARNLMAKEKASKLQSDVLGLVSSAQFRVGSLDESLKTLLEAYKVDKELGDDKLISSDLNSLAAIYMAVQQPEPGIKYIEKAIALERKMRRPDRLAIRLGLGAELHLMNNEPDKAMEMINEAYELDKRNGKDEKAAVRLIVKASILQHQNRIDEAHKTLLKALPVLEQSTNTYSLADCYNQLGAVTDKLGDRKTAMEYYKKALALSIKSGSPKTERDAERGLWETMRDDNPSVAMLHLERYTALTDSMYNKMALVRTEVMEATTKYIEQTELNENTHRMGRLIQMVAIIFAIMMAVMIAGLFYAWRKSKGALDLQRQTQAMRDRFFTNITNELETPLTVIMNAGHQLQDAGKMSAEESKRTGEIIVNHGNNMLTLVNKMLDLEKVKSAVQQPELKTGDVVMFVRLLVENFTNDAHCKLITLDFNSPMTSWMVEFAPDYIRRIGHALISNALKYTPRNGNVTVSLAAIEPGKMRLIVSDTGKGIPTEEIGRIFEPMYQSINGDDDGVGTSMDLSLVNQLVESLHGTVTVESKPNQGTKFILDIPVGVVESNDITPSLTWKDSATAKDIKHLPMAFIVENNEQVAYFIANILKGKFNVRFARDGSEALRNAQDLVPDLIITNMMMPVMDGWELIRRLREDPALNYIPIIAMTAKTTERERMSCYSAGADNVVVKPFNSSELRMLAEKLVKQHKIVREHYLKTSGNGSSDEPYSKEDKEFISKLIDVIHAQMAKDDIDMEHIAAALSISSKQLRSRVVAITGQNPSAYVLQVRLNYARRMISLDNTPLTVIASKCGFQSLSHFSKAFKQQFGVSPLQYRKSQDDISTTPPWS